MNSRSRIIEGAAELFRVYGIKSVTMDAIASHIGISKRTIYEIFSDKDELLKAVLHSMAEKQRELVVKVLGETDNAIKAIFRLLEINREHFQSMSPAFQNDLKKFHNDVLIKSDSCEMPDYRNHIQVIERGIREKLFRKDINPDLANRNLYFIGRSIMDNDMFPYETFSRREVIKNGFINYMRGISTPDGIKLINELESKY